VTYETSWLVTVAATRAKSQEPRANNWMHISIAAVAVNTGSTAVYQRQVET
jgi:hypothetical protein